MPRPRSSQYTADGFSLVEVSLALAIVGFAILPMIGLMAIGTGAVRDADEETRAAMIATTVFADLKRSSNNGGVSLQLEGRENAADARHLTYANIRNIEGKTIVMVYDDDGRLVEDLGAGSYDRGFPSAPTGVSKLVRIQFGTPAASNFYRENSAKLSQPKDLFPVEVSVEEPVTASAENRRAHRFSTFLNLTDERS